MIKKRKILISQLYYSNSIHEFLLKYHNYIDELFIDSGGFTWMNKGFKQNEDFFFNKYMQKVDKIRELNKYFKIYFIQLDKPTFPEDTKRLWQLQKEIPDFYPVFTINDNFNYLEQLSNEASLIFLGGVVRLSNISLYNYLEPSLEFEIRFSDIFKNKQSKIHILGKSTFEYNLPYIYSMDRCIFNIGRSCYRSQFIDYYKQNSKYKKYGAFMACSYVYWDLYYTNISNKKLIEARPDFVFSGGGIINFRVIFQIFNDAIEEELFYDIQDAIKNKKNYYLKKEKEDFNYKFDF